jgi:hypothetical protein
MFFRREVLALRRRKVILQRALRGELDIKNRTLSVLFSFERAFLSNVALASASEFKVDGFLSAKLQ